MTNRITTVGQMSAGSKLGWDFVRIVEKQYMARSQWYGTECELIQLYVWYASKKR